MGSGEGGVFAPATSSLYHRRDKEGDVIFFEDRENHTLYLNPKHYSEIREYNNRVAKPNKKYLLLEIPQSRFLGRDKKCLKDVRSVQPLPKEGNIYTKIESLEDKLGEIVSLNIGNGEEG